MKLIVGLGNPGREYEKTRHNVGFMTLDNLDLKFDKKKFGGIYTEKTIDNHKIIFLKPQNYINLSGQVIKKFADYFKVDINDILIIHDDMDTPLGELKLKYKGGSAGHNGLKNIELNLKTNEYKRLKIGISKNDFIDKPDYVLGKFTSEEQKKISIILDQASIIVKDYIELSFENLMNKYN